MTTNAFDFTNTDDLPEEIAGKLSVTRLASPVRSQLVQILEAAQAAGVGALSIVQIIAAGIRLGAFGNKVPAHSTCRTALNSMPGVTKPTRQTYALDAAPAPVALAAVENSGVESAGVVEDPLAALGM